MHDPWRADSALVYFARLLQHVFGAEFDAEATAFAPVLDDVNFTLRRLDFVSVQRLAPYFYWHQDHLL